jgi:uncharacterized protein (TIGR02284 family)
MKGDATMETEKVISILNGLIETCKDGEQGFSTAAEGLQDPPARSLFQQYSRQRGEMARELQAEVRRLGGDPEKSGSLAGAAHRGWINIKSLVTGKDENAIVAEAERGEDSAKKMYEEALQQPLFTQTLALVREQSMKVHNAHDRVRSLEKITAH